MVADCKLHNILVLVGYFLDIQEKMTHSLDFVYLIYMIYLLIYIFKSLTQSMLTGLMFWTPERARHNPPTLAAWNFFVLP